MSRFSVFRAAIITLLAAASAVSLASTVETHVPSTALAARSSEIIDRAVRALVALEGERHITRVWVFPTADANTVFVHYRTTTTDIDAHEPGPTIEHLVMLEMNGERIAKLHDLTDAPEVLLAAARPGEGSLHSEPPGD